MEDRELLDTSEIAIAGGDGHVVGDCCRRNQQVVVTQGGARLLQCKSDRSVHVGCGRVEGNYRKLRKQTRQVRAWQALIRL